MSFTEYNTEGYDYVQIAMLNSEWEEIAAELDIEEGDEDYDSAFKNFSNEAARRTDKPWSGLR